MRRLSFSVRPKKVSCRRLIGRASRWTQSSSTLDGRHGGGIEGGLGTGVGVAVANALTRSALGSRKNVSSAHVRGEAVQSIVANGLDKVSLNCRDSHMLSWRSHATARNPSFRGAIFMPEVC